ncbi:class II glutamine amidotransferase [bacterium]|nr:class II glutamine amidotransferase [bacterium]
MRPLHFKYLTWAAGLSGLLVLLVMAGPIQDESPAHSVNSKLPPYHNCRFWGAISSVMDSVKLHDQLIVQPQSLENISPSNPNGWALVHFAGENIYPIIRRGANPAIEDPIYDMAVAKAGEDSARIVIGHVRNCTSGLCDIPNPHPFYRFMNGKHWFLAHNGTIYKHVLMDLLRPEFLAAHPPVNGENLEEWIDSELYFLYILQTLEDHNWQMAPAMGEVVEWLRVRVMGDAEQLNFVMSDGSTLWAYREGIKLYYQFNTEAVPYSAVASKHPEAEQGLWTEMVDGQLIALRRGVPPILYNVEDYFTHTAAGEAPNAGIELGAFPNPFNPSTTLRWILPMAGKCRVSVHDVRGRELALIADAVLDAGDHDRTWRAKDSSGRPLASGVYVLRIRAGDYQSSEKLVLLR